MNANTRSGSLSARTSWTARAMGLLLVVAVAGCGDDGEGGAPCTEIAPEALRACVDDVSAAIAACYEETDAPCAAADVEIDAALATLRGEVAASCGDGDFGALSSAGVVGRLENSCSAEASSLAGRTYGGPQGAVWPNVTVDEQDCLATAHAAAATMVDGSLAAINRCLAANDCDENLLSAERQALADAARADIQSACTSLSELIAVDAPTYLARAAHQVDCMTATGHSDTGDLALSCGPANAELDPPRGEYVQVVVDGDEWGTMCGDGSDYAFWVRLAPEGERLDRVLIGLQGGGVCLFEGDCASRMENSPGLFTAMDDQPADVAIASNDPSVSPFATWTKVYLPYCTQDVFAGGGVFETLGSLEVPRYGSVNLRAAIRMVRDILWKRMDAAGGDGFRPDRLVALFGGWSAGSYGTLYNYHWLLDDLQWPRTSAFPDAGLALDNGSVLGVRGLGDVKIPAWGALPNLPPYCFSGPCAVGPVLFEAISPRLKRVPEQQMLVLTNPKDDTQRTDAFFEDDAFWINTLRHAYCDTKDLPGIQYYITSVSDESVHVVTLRPELWTGEVDGVTMRDWFRRAIFEPETLEDRAEEGDFVATIPGVEPYPCEVAP